MALHVLWVDIGIYNKVGRLVHALHMCSIVVHCPHHVVVTTRQLELTMNSILVSPTSEVSNYQGYLTIRGII